MDELQKIMDKTAADVVAVLNSAARAVTDETEKLEGRLIDLGEFLFAICPCPAVMGFDFDNGTDSEVYTDTVRNILNCETKCAPGIECECWREWVKKAPWWWFKAKGGSDD